MPPPCRSSEAEAELLREQPRRNAEGQPDSPHCRKTPSNWEFIRLGYDSEVLVPSPTDEPALRQALERFLVERQREYDARKLELAKLKALLDRGLALERAGYYSGLACWPREAYPWQLEQARIRLEWDFPQGCLKWTIADAKRRPSIRNAILWMRWTEACNVMLEDMAAQRKGFLSTLMPSCTAGQDIVASLGIRSQPNIVGQLLGCRQCYDPLQDHDQCSAGFGNASWQDLSFCTHARFLITFEDNTKIWLTNCPRRAPQNQTERQEFAMPSKNETARLERVANDISSAVPRLEAVPKQIAAKTNALAGAIAPLNRLYSEPDLAEIRRRAIGKKVPELLIDWVMTRFQASNPPRLPTKGDAFDNCGPGTLIGNKLKQSGVGISKQRFADHLTVLRRLLEEKRWLASRDSRPSRKRESHFSPENIEDYNQPSPDESAEDRDDERQKAAGLDSSDEEEFGGHCSTQSDAD